MSFSRPSRRRATRVIHAGSFALLSRDDIEYLISIAPALFEGEKQLRIEDRALAVQLGVVDSEQAFRQRSSYAVPR